jgi:hypothetical protein
LNPQQRAGVGPAAQIELLGQRQASLHDDLILARVNPLNADAGTEGSADNSKKSNVSDELRAILTLVIDVKSRLAFVYHVCAWPGMIYMDMANANNSF